MFDYKGLSLQELNKRFKLYQKTFEGAVYYEDSHFHFTLNGEIFRDDVYWELFMSEYHDCVCSFLVSDTFYDEINAEMFNQNTGVKGYERVNYKDLCNGFFEADIMTEDLYGVSTSKIFHYTEIEKFEQWLIDNYEK